LHKSLSDPNEMELLKKKHYYINKSI